MFEHQALDLRLTHVFAGLSLWFTLIWLVADSCALFSGLTAGLLPTIIIVSSYVSAFVHCFLHNTQLSAR